jgi:ankyrin repeat protein
MLSTGHFNLNTVDESGKTPLRVASDVGNAEIVQLLLEMALIVTSGPME